ncbi:MAG: hypothetical protein AAF360_09985 [Pseudomonadota bacterium]
MPCMTTIKRDVRHMIDVLGGGQRGIDALARRAGIAPGTVRRYATDGNGVVAPANHLFAFENETGAFACTRSHLEENGFIVLSTSSSPRPQSSGDDVKDAQDIVCEAAEYLKITRDNLADGIETENERRRRRTVMVALKARLQTELDELDASSQVHLHSVAAE